MANPKPVGRSWDGGWRVLLPRVTVRLHSEHAFADLGVHDNDMVLVSHTEFCTSL